MFPQPFTRILWKEHRVQRPLWLICLAIGLFTRIAAAIVGIEMLVIVFLFQWQFGYFWTARGYEFALLWALLCIAIFFKGGGRYSVDRLIGTEF